MVCFFIDILLSAANLITSIFCICIVASSETISSNLYLNQSYDLTDLFCHRLVKPMTISILIYELTVHFFTISVVFELILIKIEGIKLHLRKYT